MSSARITDGFPGGTRHSYIATQIFNEYFYSYNNGRWGTVAGADSGNCPAGRILRENGRKLYPAANPNVDQYYIGVYDAVTFLNGFIDPNDAIFALYNDNKPTYVGDSIDDAANDFPNAGPPVLTNGNIISIANGEPTYVGLYNDLTGRNSAYFGFGESRTPAPGPIDGFTAPFDPYLGIQNFAGSPYESLVYLGVNAIVPDPESPPTGSIAYLDISGAQAARAEVKYNNYEGYVGLYAGPTDDTSYGNGDVVYTGLLHAPNTCGQATMGSGTTGNTIQLPANVDYSSAIAMITRKYGGSTAHVGTITWEINNTTKILIIHSTDNQDSGTFSWFVMTPNA